MTKTICLSVAAVMALVVGAPAAAQDTGPVLRTPASTTIYTSPLQASEASCNVLNKSNHDLEVDTRLVYTDGAFLVDDTSISSTKTIRPKAAAVLSAPSISLLSGASVYCRFSFTGNANQVRAIMVGKHGDGAVSSEAR